MDAILKYLQNRLQENTTWYAIFLVASAYGFDLDPAKRDAFTYLGMVMAAAPNVKVGRLKDEKITEIGNETNSQTDDSSNNKSNEDLNNILNVDRNI